MKSAEPAVAECDQYREVAGVSHDEKIPVESDDSEADPAQGDGVAGLSELSELDELRAELEGALGAATEARDEVLRARAEVENIRKRAERDVSSAHKFGLERFVGDLLPIKDSMDLGYDALDATTDIDAIREGMTLTAKMFDTALEKAGVVAIDPTGEAFDPEFHQAMAMQPSSDAAPGTVLAVMQKGYLLNERLIRPAMVVVAKAPDAE